jgi:hypothetical protein
MCTGHTLISKCIVINTLGVSIRDYYQTCAFTIDSAPEIVAERDGHCRVMRSPIEVRALREPSEMLCIWRQSRYRDETYQHYLDLFGGFLLET